MRPTPIPDCDVWPSAERLVIGPPLDDPEDGFGTVRSVEACVDEVDVYDGVTSPRFNMRIELEDGDLEKLSKDGHFWVSFIGPQLMPFDVGLVPAGVQRISGE